MRCCIIPIAAHRPTRLRRTGTIPSTASIFLTQRPTARSPVAETVELVKPLHAQWPSSDEPRVSR
jgi:hypothetical protein